MKRYKIISELGKGATGVVYRAVRSGDGSTVALKKLVLPGHLDAREEEEFINRFKSEAKAALDMDHDGVVRALDCGLDEGTFYIAYELVDGVTLEEALKSGREFSPEEVADILVQTGEALAYAHDRGVVHRDISPGNIFITESGGVKVSDFGVARFVTRATVVPGQESIVGTPGYMAPEQVTGGEADPRSDIFSLGCVAYELLAGRPAFTGENIAQIIHRVLNTQPPPLREMNPRVPLAFEEVVFRMLAKNPDYRYQNMGEVVTAASRILEDFPSLSRRSVAAMSAHEPVLVSVEGPLEGKEFRLLPTVTTMGKSLGDILLKDDGKVSPQHAWITNEGGNWVLYDADSESGTFLNGEKIEREEILPGDRIRIGSTVLEFRGAGGHKGAFKEGEIPAEKKVIETVSDKKKIPWVIILLLVIPGVIVAGALIYFGWMLPSQFMARLDAQTRDRWNSTMEKFEVGTIGTVDWQLNAAEAVNNLGENTPEPIENMLAPAWLPSSDRINTEVRYRYQLLNLLEEFAVAAASYGIQDDEGGASETSPYAAIRALETRIQGIDVPGNITPAWEGRKNQLLSMVRRWVTHLAQSTGGTGIPTESYDAEFRQANGYLLDGYYIYTEAGDRIELLSEAYSNFENCYNIVSSVIQENPTQEKARAVRALAQFLSAKVLQGAGNPDEPEIYERALVILDNANVDISYVSRDSWEDIIPRDFNDTFPSPSSLLSQIRATRHSISSELQKITGNTENES